MPSTALVDSEERRARLATRHHLAPLHRAPDVATIAADLVGVHSTDAASVYLGVLARMAEPSVAMVEGALYEERVVARILGMRRTMFVVPLELVPVIHHACTLPLSRNERRRVITLVEGAGLVPAGGGEEWLRRVEAETSAALLRRGEAVASELSQDVPELREQIPFGEGKKWAGTQGLSTRVLFLLAAEGRVIRTRPRGSWTSTQYRWATISTWLGRDITELAMEEARAELVARYLRSFGPVTSSDIRWWTGWPAREVNQVLGTLTPPPIEVRLEDGDHGYLAGDDPGPLDVDGSWAALLPALDSTVMGWTVRGWYLGPHRSALFDKNGNAGPTVWWDGRVVGGWAQRSDGEIVVRLLEEVGSRAEGAIRSEAQRVRDLVGSVRFIPRFRTPLERELAAS